MDRTEFELRMSLLRVHVRELDEMHHAVVVKVDEVMREINALTDEPLPFSDAVVYGERASIVVTPEGREDIYLPDRESLKGWITEQGFDAIHNFSAAGPMVIGADHDVESVLADIDAAERVALLLGDQARGNLGHCLALVMPEGHDDLPERLEMYDIGEVTEADLSVLDSGDQP